MYNETLFKNATTIFDTASAANNVTSPPFLFSIVLLIVLWFIFFIIPLINWGFSNSFTFSSLLNTIFAAFLWALEELPSNYILVPLVIFLIGVFFVVLEKSKN